MVPASGRPASRGKPQLGQRDLRTRNFAGDHCRLPRREESHRQPLSPYCNGSSERSANFACSTCFYKHFSVRIQDRLCADAHSLRTPKSAMGTFLLEGQLPYVICTARESMYGISPGCSNAMLARDRGLKSRVGPRLRHRTAYRVSLTRNPRSAHTTEIA